MLYLPSHLPITWVRSAVLRYLSTSVCKKTDVFTDHLTQVNMDLVAIMESWLSTGDKDNKTIKDLMPADYKLVHVPWKNRRVGGIGFVYRSSFRVAVSRCD